MVRLLLYIFPPFLFALDTPSEFARKCKTDKDCMSSMVVGLDQFWNLSLSNRDLLTKNNSYNFENEMSNLPSFLRSSKQMELPSLRTGLCLAMANMTMDEHQNFSYTSCNYDEDQRCVFAVKLEDKVVFESYCDLGNSSEKNCSQFGSYSCSNYFLSGIFMNTQCCADDGIAVLRSHVAMDFFKENPVLSDILETSLHHRFHMLDMINYIDVPAVIRYSVLGVGLFTFAGITAVIILLYRKVPR